MRVFLSPTLLDVSTMLSLAIEGVSIHHDMNCKEHDKVDIE